MSTSRDGDRAFAMLNRKIPDDQAMDAMRAALDRTTALHELEERSIALGRELSRWLGHHDESIAFCERCGARIYVRVGAPNVHDGEGLTDRCPSPPAQSPAPPVPGQQRTTPRPALLQRRKAAARQWAVPLALVLKTSSATRHYRIGGANEQFAEVPAGRLPVRLIPGCCRPQRGLSVLPARAAVPLEWLHRLDTPAGAVVG